MFVGVFLLFFLYVYIYIYIMFNHKSNKLKVIPLKAQPWALSAQGAKCPLKAFACTAQGCSRLSKFMQSTFDLIFTYVLSCPTMKRKIGRLSEALIFVRISANIHSKIRSHFLSLYHVSLVFYNSLYAVGSVPDRCQKLGN